MTDQSAERRNKQTIEQPTAPGWRPAKKLQGLKARSGYTARWVSADPENVARKKSEGWILMKPSDNIAGSFDTKDVNDGGSAANDIRYRDLIAMMLPDEIKRQRNEYYRNENAQAAKAIMKNTDAGIAKMGGSTYKPKGMQGKIVIE